ncbi:hypothetical protein ACFYOA_25770 [Streptomyces iakyrus]|uniref:hypothetical protein n=1 Tax=Streptomyces iakyrus TaxID=68219 RepID=UPI003690F871
MPSRVERTGPASRRVRRARETCGSLEPATAATALCAAAWSGAWPPASTAPVALYLTPDGGLSTTPPTAPAASVAYDFDPRHPVPTVGGQVASGEPVMSGGACDQNAPDARVHGARDAEQPELLTPGEVYENSNTGEPEATARRTAMATNTVHKDARHPSHLRAWQGGLSALQ